MGKASALDRILAAAAAGVFAPVARMRGSRAVHAHGVGFEATLTSRGAEWIHLAPASGSPRTVRAVVRLSPSFDIPRPLPDFLGLAIKLPDAHGVGRDQDFLLVTAVGARLARYVPLPARSYEGRTFSSILPYRSAGRLVLPGAVAAGSVPETGEDAATAAVRAALDGTLRFTLTVAPALGRLVPLGDLTPERALTPKEVEGLRFDPFNTAESLVPAAGPLNAMRRGAYPASRRARPRTP